MAGAGDNQISVNSYMSKGKISIGGGKDFVSLESSSESLINLGSGRNTITSDNVVNNTKNTVIAGDGSDSINISGNENFINAGSGRNYIYLAGGENNTLVAGGGRDTINLDEASSGNMIVFSGGNDIVLNFHDSDSVAAIGTLSKIIVGSDAILTDGISQMILKGAADKDIQTVTLDSASDAYNALLNASVIGDTSLPDGTEDTTSSDLMKIISLTQRGDNHSNTLDGAVILALGGNDTITSTGKEVSIEGDAGNDLISLGSYSENNFIFYTANDGSDTIYGFNATSTLSVENAVYHSLTSNNDLIVMVDNGAVLLKDAATLSAINIEGTLASGEEILKINKAVKSPVVIGADSETVDASKRITAIQITGNAQDNSIIGSSKNDTLDGASGDDTLTGGSGNDIFIYSGGNDIITDYATTDKISTASDYRDFEIDGNDLVLNFSEENSLTIIKGAGKAINLNSSVNCYADGGILDAKQKSATLSADTDTFNATPYSKLVAISGAAVANEVNIIGNKKGNKIYAGNNDSTLNGGKGNDTLYGGAGADNFIYQVGNGNDVIMDYESDELLQILDKRGRAGNFKNSVFSNNELTLTINGGGKVIFRNVSSETAFNINGESYRVRGNTLTK